MWTMNDQRVLPVACPVTKQCAGAGNKHKDMIANKIRDFCRAQSYPEKITPSICRPENLPGDLHAQPPFTRVH